ncbi:unnamed protein product, partial [Strongylus vulgaris]
LISYFVTQIFVLADEKFEDVRYSFDEWPEHKSEMPFGQLPVLEVDGQQLAQSHAIARYLAKKFGLAPKCPFEEALVDSIMDQYKDFLNEIRLIFRVLGGVEQGDVIKAHAEKVRSNPALKEWIETRPQTDY